MKYGPILALLAVALLSSSHAAAGAPGCPGAGVAIGETKISATQGGFAGALDDGDVLGSSVAPLGDLDGDGVNDLAVGAFGDDDGGQSFGAVWIMFLSAENAVKAHQKISATEGGFGAGLDAADVFGISLAALGDLDGDGVTDIAVGATGDDDGGNSRGAVWIVFLNANGTVKAKQKISQTAGGFGGALSNGGNFGRSLVALGDLDGDGVTELAVGASADDDGGNNRGAAWVLFLNANGTVKTEQKISSLQGGFSGPLSDGDEFGSSVAAIGDLNGDGVRDLVVGAMRDDDGGPNRGALWVLFLNANGTVSSAQKISGVTGGFSGALDDDDTFGWSAASLGDLNNDGIVDLAAGAPADDDGGNDRGAVWILFLDSDGTVRDEQKISDTAGGFGGVLDVFDNFGRSVSVVGDLDGDGSPELTVGAPFDDDGGIERGAVWLASMFVCAEAPVVMDQPQSVLLPVGGGPATFIVGASGSVPLAYRWRKDGVDLNDGGSVSGAFTATLMINASNDDVGVYDCVVSNTFGAATTSGAVLGIRPSCDGDVDGDGDVDFADLNRLLSGFGLFCQP